MKKLMMLAMLGLMPVSTVVAQEEVKPLVLPITMPCNLTSVIFDILDEKFQETPIALANGSVYGPDGKPVPGQILLWNNTESTSYTVTFTPTGTDVTCFLTSGKDLEFMYSMLGDAI